jgi:hypothetical protein
VDVDVESMSDRERSDVTHPRGPRFAREKGERVGGKEERKSLSGVEGVEVGVKAVSAQKSVEGGEVRTEVGL